MGVSEGNIVLYSTFKNIVKLLCAFTLVPKISLANVKKPLLVGFGGYIVSLVLLLAASFGVFIFPLLVASCALSRAFSRDFVKTTCGRTCSACTI